MNKFLKNIFNFNVFASCLISTIGYGLGYAIADYYDMPVIICLICCFALGIPFDSLAKKIVKTVIIDDSKKRRILLVLIVYIFYVIAWFITYRLLNHDLDYDLIISFLFIIAFQLISLFMSYIKSLIKK